MSAPERYTVAILALGTSPEVEAKALAADLGTIAYEERLKLAAGVPAIVLATLDRSAADDLAAKLRARKHRVLVCPTSSVVPANAMVSMRRFELDAEGLAAGDALLPWADLAVIVHARHHTSVETVETVKEKKFNVGRALMTGGLMMHKSEKREVLTRTQETEHVLYLFRASGEAPWLLREQGTHYGALGAALAPTATKNFAIAILQLRARAPHARFDDQLIRRPVPDVDLYAHLVAAS